MCICIHVCMYIYICWDWFPNKNCFPSLATHRLWAGHQIKVVMPAMPAWAFQCSSFLGFITDILLSGFIADILTKTTANPKRTYVGKSRQFWNRLSAFAGCLVRRKARRDKKGCCWLACTQSPGKIQKWNSQFRTLIPLWCRLWSPEVDQFFGSSQGFGKESGEQWLCSTSLLFHAAQSAFLCSPDPAEALESGGSLGCCSFQVMPVRLHREMIGGLVDCIRRVWGLFWLGLELKAWTAIRFWFRSGAGETERATL